MNDIEIREVIVNKIPDSCGKCPLMQWINDTSVCVVLPSEYWEITGNPYDMCYRRSDCKLKVRT